MIVRNRKLNPHQHRFKSTNHEKDQRIHDIHQADLLMIDRRHPLVHHIQRWAPLCLQRLIDGFEYRSRVRHAALLPLLETREPQPVSEALSDRQ